MKRKGAGQRCRAGIQVRGSGQGCRAGVQGGVAGQGYRAAATALLLTLHRCLCYCAGHAKRGYEWRWETGAEAEALRC